MADTSAIEWTDATWNIVTGCSVLSPGCANCYAMRLAGTRLKHHPSRIGLTLDTKAGPVWTGVTRVNWKWIDQPLSWTRPRMIFVCAHGDLFHKTVAWEDIAVIYGVMIAAHHLRGHIFQVLTKRASRMRTLLTNDAFWALANAHASALVMGRVDPLDRRRGDARATCDDYGRRNPPPGIWHGVSVEDQRRADERVLDLLAAPARLHWLSCEPLLGPVDPTRLAFPKSCDCAGSGPTLNAFDGTVYCEGCCEGAERLDLGTVNWIVAGGESGPGARPMHPDWARSLRDQCADAGVPFFFKQWGDWAPGEIAGAYLDPDRAAKGATYFDGRWEDVWSYSDGHADDEPDLYRIGKKRAGRTLDGVAHDGMPA